MNVKTIDRMFIIGMFLLGGVTLFVPTSLLGETVKMVIISLLIIGGLSELGGCIKQWCQWDQERRMFISEYLPEVTYIDLEFDFQTRTYELMAMKENRVILFKRRYRNHLHAIREVEYWCRKNPLIKSALGTIHDYREWNYYTVLNKTVSGGD